MANEVPEEFVTQILLCLPVVSLLRFKSVCKSWYTLITHQYFITKHLLHNKNKNSNNHPFLNFPDKTTEEYVVSTLSYETLQVSLTQPLPPQFCGISKEKRIFVGGSCNGLVCIYNGRASKVVIWNPATKETKVVSKSNVPRFAPAGYRTMNEGIGFGFDAKTNDYKIIHLFYMYDPNSYHCFSGWDCFGHEIEFIHQKEVYSLSANSWRKVDGPSCFPNFIAPRTYINGMASWNATVVWWRFLLSFDMSDEVFIKTRLPDDTAQGDVHFFVLNESIAMAATIWNTESSTINCLHIWLLLEVGVPNSWTKLFTIGPDTKIDRLTLSGFWKNNTVLFKGFDDRRLVLYDRITKEITNLRNSRITMSQLVTYMETLVSVRGGNEFEEQNNC